MRNSRRPNLRLASLLGIAGLICWAIGGSRYDDPSGGFVAGIGLGALVTVVLLVLVSRHIKKRRSSVFGMRRSSGSPATFAYGGLIGGLSGLAGGGAPFIIIAGTAMGMMVTVLVWAAVDPSQIGRSPQRRNSGAA